MRPIALIAVLAIAGTSMASAQDEPMRDRIHFLIPGGAGGGWDGSARGVGEALTRSGLVGNTSFENMSGGGGGLAMTYLIDNAESNRDTLMINSTPMIIRGLTGQMSQTYEAVTPIASVLGDYGALVVAADSDIETFGDFVDAYQEDPNSVATGGGSVPGGMDHLVASLILEGADINSAMVQYIPYDAGGSAMAALLSGEIEVLATGFSEAIDLRDAGEVRIVGVTAPERLESYPEVPTFAEQGSDVDFVNWRGFFAVPDLSEDAAADYHQLVTDMLETPEWEEVRARNGWTTIHFEGDEFMDFLSEQETQMRDLMTNLGFL